MSPFSFNAMFAGLMVLAGGAAFGLPRATGERVRASTAAVFIPIAKPARAVGEWADRTFGAPSDADPESPAGPRPSADVAAENQRLRVLVQSLKAQLADLQTLNSVRNQLGELRNFCQPAGVIGTDSGTRQAIAINTASLGGPGTASIDNAPVLTSRGLIGRVTVGGAGIGSARVRLITDRGVRTACRVERFAPTRPAADATDRWDTAPVTPQIVPLAAQPVLVEGVGPNALQIRLMKEADARLVRAGDWLVLDDSAWPAPLKGYRVGRVTSIEPVRSAPGFFDLRVEPAVDLLQLSSVEVMMKGR